MKKNEVKTIEDLNLYYSKIRTIKFEENTSIKRVLTIKKLLFEEYSPTFYIRNGHHCVHGKYRSIDDYFNLCKTYFPKKKLSYFAKVWLKDEKKKENKNKNMILIRYCPNIRKHNSGGLYQLPYFYYSGALKYDEKLNTKLILSDGLPQFSLKEISNN